MNTDRYTDLYHREKAATLPAPKENVSNQRQSKLVAAAAGNLGWPVEAFTRRMLVYSYDFISQ